MRVLIVSTGFMDIAGSFKEAFCRLGVQCDTLLHEEVRASNTFVSSAYRYLRRKNSKHNRKEVCESIDEFSEEVLNWCSRNEPDIVLDLLGANLNSKCVERLSDKYYVIKYMLDLIENYSILRNTIKFYSQVFTYETYDMQNLVNIGAKNVKLLYATYDKGKYFNTKNDPIYDIAFVGKMFTKEQTKRVKILNQLINSHPEYSYAIYGIMAKPYQLLRYLRWRIYDGGKYYKNYNVSSNDARKIYSQSKICLNINSYQTVNTWSSRVLEMMATGVLTITNTTKAIHSILGDGVVEYHNSKELLSSIEYYLSHEAERKQIALKGEIISYRFTMDNTVRQIVRYYNIYANKKDQIHEDFL